MFHYKYPMLNAIIAGASKHGPQSDFVDNPITIYEQIVEEMSHLDKEILDRWEQIIQTSNHRLIMAYLNGYVVNVIDDDVDVGMSCAFVRDSAAMELEKSFVLDVSNDTMKVLNWISERI